MIFGVDALSGTQLLCYLELLGVHVNANDVRSPDCLSTLDDREADGTETKNSDRREWLNLGVVPDSSKSCCNAAAKQACRFEFRLGVNLGAGNLCKYGILGESRAAHEVVDCGAVLLQCKAGGAIWHDTLALGASDLRAKIGLGAHAEDAIGSFALWCVAWYDVITRLH